VKVAGCTVHFVDEHLDHGVIVVQRAIPVLETDDAHSLAERILAEEHIAYSEAIARVAGAEYEIRGRRFVKRNPRDDPAPAAAV
jgi:phosphoribosylglycinamide formyltransferase-1